MFYRQGMIMPGHPNNTGQKPLLIGSEEQIKAQMQYIYRGNYGLISEDEIIAAVREFHRAKPEVFGPNPFELRTSLPDKVPEELLGDALAEILEA